MKTQTPNIVLDLGVGCVAWKTPHMDALTTEPIFSCGRCAGEDSTPLNEEEVRGLIHATGAVDHVHNGDSIEMRCSYCSDPQIIIGADISKEQAQMWLHGVHDPDWELTRAHVPREARRRRKRALNRRRQAV